LLSTGLIEKVREPSWILTRIRRKEDTVSSNPKRTRGFSLIELMTVIAVVSVTAAVAIPLGLNYMRHYEVIGAVQNVATTMQHTRAQAVKRNTRRGVILSFDYPSAGQFQFTTLDEDPVNGGWDGSIFPENPGVFDPTPPREYGAAPVPPANTASPGAGRASPHGIVNNLPQNMEFVGGQAYTSLLFRIDGSVEAVNTDNVTTQAIAQVGLDWVVTVIHPEYELTRTISVSRNGRIVVSQN